MKIKSWYSKKNLAFKVAFYVVIFSFSIASFLIYHYLSYKYSVTNDTMQKAGEEAEKTGAKLEDEFRKAIFIADEISFELSNGELQKADIKDRLLENISNRDEIFGIGVVYIPYMNDPTIRLTSPYYVSKDSIKNIDRQELIKVYSSPIYIEDTLTNSKILTGAVYIDFLISDLKDIMATLELGKSGYGFMLSQNGTFIAHPIREYNLSEFDDEQKTVFKVADDQNDQRLAELGKRTVIQHSSGIIDHTSTLTGQDSWMFYQPIESLGWSLIVVFIKEDLEIDISKLRNLLIWISLLMLFFSISLFSIISKAYEGRTIRLWLFVGLTSFSLISEIGYMWYLALAFNTDEDLSYTKIVDRTGVDKYTSTYYKQVSNICKEPPLYIPTGVYIEAIDFPNATNVFLSGYIWQKYSDEVLAELDTVGIFFPEAVIKKDITLSYKTKEDGFTKYAWYFKTIIKKTFDYTKYPLDYKNLLIEISPKDISKNVILTPDLEAYKYLNPNMLPGLSDNLTLSGWETTSSNFVFKQNDYKLDFGLAEFGCKEKAPVLFFDIKFSRDFAGTIISKSIPIVVMLFIMFVLLTITTKNIDYVTRILGISGSFFFAIIFSHVSTRNDLAVKGIVYFEYFFISMYVMILIGFIDTIFYYQNHTLKKNKFFFDYKNNLISKLIFWPFFCTLFLVITIYFLMIK